MKILFRKKFKKLREEYKDLGDVKLTIIESKVNSNPNSSSGLSLSFGETGFDDAKVSRSAEYFVKYRALVQSRDNARIGIISTATAAFFGWMIKKGIDVSKNNSTLSQEYHKGRRDQINDWEDIAVEYNGEEAWLGDVDDGRHLYIKVSDEEYNDYKCYMAAEEKAAEEKAAEDETVII